jgi:hypothetical protein
MVFSLMVEPKDQSTLLPDQFASVALGSGGTLDVALSDPITITGTVVRTVRELSQDVNQPPPKAVAGDLLVGGRIVVTSSGRIPGTQFRSESLVKVPDTNSTSGQQAFADPSQAETFSLRVLPGMTYDGVFVPEASDLPPYFFTVQFATSGRYDVVLPADDAYPRISGRIVVDTTLNAPVPGARVLAIREGVTIGTTALTAEDGLFTLVLAPGPGPLSIQVGSEGSLLFPERSFLFQDASEAAVPAFQLLAIGPVPAMRTVSVQAYHQGADGAEVSTVSGAKVVATGRAGDGDVQVSATTGKDGIATLKLLDGLYGLRVIPPITSPYALYQGSLDFSKLAVEDGEVLYANVPLSLRVTVKGRVVRDSDGAGVGSAVVSFSSSQISALKGAAGGQTEVGFDAVTAADGSFELAADPGDYAITIVPPADSGLARFSQPDALVGENGTSVTVRLPAGSLVRGRVVSASAGSPVAQASVRFFYAVSAAKVDDMWSVQNTSFALSVLMAGTSITDADGRFSVVLPTLDAASYVGGGDPAEADGTSPFGLPAVDLDQM